MHHLLAASHPFEAPDAGHLFNYAPLWNGAPAWLTYPMLILALVTIAIALFFLRAFRAPKLVPVGAQNVGEAGIEFVDKQIAFPVLGENARAWLPFLTAVFFWIFFLN